MWFQPASSLESACANGACSRIETRTDMSVSGPFLQFLQYNPADHRWHGSILLVVKTNGSKPQLQLTDGVGYPHSAEL